MPSDVKTKAATIGKRVLSELALHFLDEDFINNTRKFLEQYGPSDMITLIAENKFIDLGYHLPGAKTYKAFIEAVPLQRSCEIMLEIIAKARPDLAAVIQAAGADGATWLVNNVIYLRGEVMSGEPKPEESPKKEEPELQLTKATCTACKREWVIEKKDIKDLKQCPFCSEPYIISKSSKEVSNE